jgi:Raf kinase inhibitor-like YbhB/YbcL family protein
MEDTMKLSSTSIRDGQPIAPEFAFCNADPETHVTLGPNRSPQLSWEGAPEGTRSFAIVCYDPDVPSKPDDVNQEGRTVPDDLPRIDFYHWVLVDIPADVSVIEEGADSSEVTASGKEQTPGPHGSRRGINSYTDWFAGDADMGGDYYGYDGPCPPWNDSIPHHYIFTVYALDMERCPVEGRFGGPEALATIAGHVLAQASITCTYSVNPDVPA